MKHNLKDVKGSALNSSYGLIDKLTAFRGQTLTTTQCHPAKEAASANHSQASL